jgi:hypothetical protein
LQQAGERRRLRAARVCGWHDAQWRWALTLAKSDRSSYRIASPLLSLRLWYILTCGLAGGNKPVLQLLADVQIERPAPTRPTDGKKVKCAYMLSNARQAANFCFAGPCAQHQAVSNLVQAACDYALILAATLLPPQFSGL